MPPAYLPTVAVSSPAAGPAALGRPVMVVSSPLTDITLP